MRLPFFLIFIRLPFIILSFILSVFSGYCQSVDPLTGRATIQIPLGSVKALDLSVGVGLVHNGGALTVSEGPGSAGMGWGVDAGGYISREVRGLPDEFTNATDARKGWLSNGNAANIQGFASTADDNLSVCTDELTDYNFINGNFGLNDMEPDVYYFSAPGLSGKFIYGSDGQPKLIPYQDIQVTSTGTGTAIVFTIKTNTGITYTFGSTEVVNRQSILFRGVTALNHFRSGYAYYQSPISFIATWNLTSIQSAATGTTVSLNYSTDEENVSSRYVTLIAPSQTSSVDTLYYLTDTSTPKLLTSISLKNYSINLTWLNSLVNKVSIVESETGDTKTYQLVYKSFRGIGDGPVKPFLMQVKQQNACNSFPPYVLTYNGIDTTNIAVNDPVGRANVYWKTQWGQDFFGYNNGQSTNKNIPTVYYYQNETGARRLRLTPIPSLAYTELKSGIGSMAVNAAYTNFGSIARIDFPSGGWTAFAYEPNKYFDTSTNEELLGPGVRVLSVTKSGGSLAYGKATDNPYQFITQTYQYTTTNAGVTTSGKILYPSTFGYASADGIYRSQSNLGPPSQVMYTRVRESISGYGWKVYNFDVPNAFPDLAPVAPANKVARGAGATCSVGYLKNGNYTYPFAPLQDLGFKRGLLTKIAEYDQAGLLTRERRMNYFYPQPNSTVKALRVESIKDVNGNETFHYSPYLIPVNQSRILLNETQKSIGELSQADSTKVTTAYSYNSKNMIKQTTETRDDNSVANNYVKYALDFAITTPTVNDIQADAISKLNSPSVNRYGEVIEQYQSYTPIGGTAAVTGAKLTVFRDFSGRVLPYQSYTFPQGLSFTAAVATTGATQGFTRATPYILDNTLEYVNNMPVNQTGLSLIPNGVHYSNGSVLPVANFVNCKAENAVYEGFEFVTDRGLTFSGTGAPVTQPGWTGKNSKEFGTTNTLGTINLVTKAGNSYRISCYAYATQAATITVQAKSGSTVQSTMTLSYATPNQWAYLEGVINTSAVAATFSLNISATVTIRLDDFIAMPSAARVSTSTYLPLIGVTSQTDDRGNSVVINYDNMGRKVNTLDRQRNIVELQEYTLQKKEKKQLNANFSSSGSYLQGTPTMLQAADASCYTGATTYQWTFTGPTGVLNVPPSASPSYAWTPTSIGSHIVRLIVANPSYSTVSFSHEVDVRGNVGINLTVSPDNVFNTCTSTGMKTFTATISGIVPDPVVWTLDYQWSISNASGEWVVISEVPGVIVNGPASISYQSPAFNYRVQCAVVASRPGEEPIELAHEVSLIAYVNPSSCP